jgi:hypothetical protein
MSLTITLRTSGGDFSTWDAMAMYVQSLVVGGSLTTDVIINIQGGATFGQDDILNVPLTPDNTNWNGKTIKIQTAPTELANTAIVIGVMWCGTGINGGQTNGFFEIDNLICHATITTQTNGVGFIKCYAYTAPNPVVVTINNCILAQRYDMLTFYFDVGSMNNCIYAITQNYGERTDVDLIPNWSAFKFNNNSFLTYSAMDITVYNAGIDNNTHKNNTCYNYGVGSMHFSDGSEVGPPQIWTWVNSIENVDPNLETAIYITDPTETPAAVIARSAKLTALSAACLESADPTYAPATDIIGNPRP